LYEHAKGHCQGDLRPDRRTETSCPYTGFSDLFPVGVFTWIQSRIIRLTKDMVPQKGKALILLRTLNELLRRLLKMVERNTEFYGGILI
jgi:hypothetical protein